MAANVLMDSRRVLEEVTHQKLKLAEAKQLLQESDYNARSVLNHTKGQCSDLKMTWVELQTRAKILEYLEKGRASWPEFGAVDADVKNAKKKASGLKKEAAQLEKQLSDLAEQAATKYDEHVEKLSKFQERLAQVEKTKGKLEDLLKKHQSVEESINTQVDQTFNMAAILQEQTEGMKKAQSALSSCCVAMVMLHQNIAMVTEERDKYRSLVQAAEHAMKQIWSRKEQGTERLLAQTAWCKEAYKVLSQLSGVEEQSLVGKSLTVRLLPPDSSCSISPLLTVHFREHLPGGFTLEEAVVDPPSLEVDDLIKVAVETNNALFLVTRVQERFFTHMPLLQEIEALRNRYAIDYQAAQSRVQVMLGEGGRITCTLDIGKGYPGAEGVSLVETTGLPEGTSLQDLLPPASDHMTLEQWMTHLTTVCSQW